MRPVFIALVGLGIVGYFLMRKWTPPARADQFLPHIYAAEHREKLPHNMLARLLHQESRYRPEIIDGSLKSSAGAVGIAQIVPRWHPDVNPKDPVESIHYAARYLRSLYDQFRPRVSNEFDGWRLALAAYNWGPGNQAKDLLDQVIGNEWPAETKSYVSEILSDVVVV